MRVIHINREGNGAGAAATATTSLRPVNEVCMPPPLGFNIQDFLRQQITTTELDTERMAQQIAAKKETLKRHEEELEAGASAAAAAAATDDTYHQTLQKGIDKLKAEIASLEVQRVQARTQLEFYYRQTQIEQEMMQRQPMAMMGGAGAGAGACAGAGAGARTGAMLQLAAGSHGAEGSIAAPSVLPYWSCEDAYASAGAGAAAAANPYSSFDGCCNGDGCGRRGAGAGACAGAGNKIFQSTPISLLDDLKELKTGADPLPSNFRVTAADLQEVGDVDDGGAIEGWLHPEDDYEEEEYEMSDYSKRIEAKLRDLLNEIQMDRLREPDATTWLYHISGVIENVKMDLSS